MLDMSHQADREIAELAYDDALEAANSGFELVGLGRVMGCTTLVHMYYRDN
jgi:hypothetical protein